MASLLALTLTLLSSPAQAAPTRPLAAAFDEYGDVPPVQGAGAGDPRPRVSRTHYLSDEVQAEIKLDYRITYTSVNRTTKVMDYGAANKYNPGKLTNVRIFAAGFLFGGGRLSGISPEETAKVRSYIPSIAGSTVAPDGTVTANSTECYGRHGYVPLSPAKTTLFGEESVAKFNYYFTSCETILLVAAAAAVSLTAGTAMALGGPAAPAIGLIGLLVGLGGIYIAALAGLSTENAIGAASRYSLIYGFAQ